MTSSPGLGEGSENCRSPITGERAPSATIGVDVGSGCMIAAIALGGTVATTVAVGTGIPVVTGVGAGLGATTGVGSGVAVAATGAGV